ncbi:hypothetical protein [Mucilaginibacter defluvii]|uniref:hypothetical protein n=1 Tax=Mucilaginibacter defluvii TaxID=1196019 RepID=UPI0031EE7BEF
MKTTNRLSIHFKVRVEREKNGKAPVYLGLTVNGTKCYLALKGVVVDLLHWDISNGCGKKSRGKAERSTNIWMTFVLLSGNITGNWRLKVTG